MNLITQDLKRTLGILLQQKTLVMQHAHNYFKSNKLTKTQPFINFINKKRKILQVI